VNGLFRFIVLNPQMLPSGGVSGEGLSAIAGVACSYLWWCSDH